MDSYSSVDRLGNACRGYLLKRASGKQPRERMDRRRFTREATGWMAQLLTIGPFAEGTIRLSTDGTPDGLWQTIGRSCRLVADALMTAWCSLWGNSTWR